jgi:hypothetical protein
LDRLRCRLVVPMPTLEEFAARSDSAISARRLSRLLTLSDRLGRRFVLAPNVAGIFAKERATPLTRTPRQAPVDGTDPMDLFRRPDVEASLGRLATDLQKFLDKDRWLATDREAQEIGAEKFKEFEPKDLYPHMETLLGSSFFWDTFGHHIEDHNLDEAKANPVRFATGMMALGYAFLNGAGSMFASAKGFGRYVGLLGKPRKGNWHDLQVAACCARSDLLLTCDHEQEVRVNYLAEQFRLRVRAIQVSKWLASGGVVAQEPSG